MTDRPLQHFTFRELLSQRSIAERAVRRNRNVETSTALIEAINAELALRRERIFEKRSKGIVNLDLGVVTRTLEE